MFAILLVCWFIIKLLWRLLEFCDKGLLLLLLAVFEKEVLKLLFVEEDIKFWLERGLKLKLLLLLLGRKEDTVLEELLLLMLKGNAEEGFKTFVLVLLDEDKLLLEKGTSKFEVLLLFEVGLKTLLVLFIEFVVIPILLNALKGEVEEVVLLLLFIEGRVEVFEIEEKVLVLVLVLLLLKLVFGILLKELITLKPCF